MKPKFTKAKDIKVGVIGYGPAFNMGKGHLSEMKLAGMTPSAVCELDAERRAVAARDFPGIETYASVATMLKKSGINLVTVITPHNTHARLALQCLKAGCHVVCEKPLAITTAECDAMIAAARKNRLMLSTYHNRHWDGCMLQAVKKIKREKVIGEVYKAAAHMGGYSQPREWWRSSKSISGGILYDWGVHLLEWSLQIIDADITEVSGFARQGYWAKKTPWKEDTIEDEGFAAVRFKSGAWLTLGVTALDANPPPGQVEFTGTKGSYIMEGGGYTIIKKVDGEKMVTSGRNPKGKQELFYKEIAKHLTKGTPLTITAEWSRRPIHIIDLACRSAKAGKAIKAKYP